MTTDSKPFLGRCKQCDYAVFATEEDIPNGNTFRDILAGGVCRVAGREFGRCTSGHKFFPLKRIKGTYSESFKCDSRCLNAKGHECTCSCGGANHGRGHAVQVVPVEVTARVSYPRDDPNWDIERHEREQKEFANEPEEDRYPKQHIGERGETIYFEAKLMHKREGRYDATLYSFLTEVRTPIVGELLGEAEIKWWKPDFVEDPGFKVGEVYKLKAKVKFHEHHPQWGKSTVVTYLEETV